MKKVETVKITTEYITLGQFLKLVDLIGNGGEAKMYIANHNILVNNEPCAMRGKKLFNGDKIFIDESMLFEISK